MNFFLISLFLNIGQETAILSTCYPPVSIAFSYGLRSFMDLNIDAAIDLNYSTVYSFILFTSFFAMFMSFCCNIN